MPLLVSAANFIDVNFSYIKEAFIKARLLIFLVGTSFTLAAAF